MKRTFEIETKKRKMAKVQGKRVTVTEPMNLTVELVVDGKLIDLRYGYKSWFTTSKEGWDSYLRGQVYHIHHSIKPQEGDVWKYKNRTFVVGKIEGFIIYQAPLLDNGKEVARIKFEDYYKD